jgi:RND superfamily putative drug exporter
VEGVEDIRALTQPVGKVRAPAGRPAKPASGLGGLLLRAARWHRDLFYRLAAHREYLAGDRRAMRMVVVLTHPALSREAMQAVRALRDEAGAFLADQEVPAPLAAVHLAGATAEMDDVRVITAADFRRIVCLVVALICVVLVALLRKPLLALLLAGCTVLGYLAALGVTEWVFHGLLGAAGLDWKVQVFLFVVMVAVGVDYTIFLAARMVEEARRAPAETAIRRAVVHTGPVISSCGVIMAATLGSLMTGDLALLHQLGFAFALGMLLDTFVVRPLLVPSFAAVLWRGRGPADPSARSTQGAEPV